MDIAISINGVLRDLFGKIKQVHQKYYDSDIKEDLNYDNIVKVLDFKDEDQLLEFYMVKHLWKYLVTLKKLKIIL